MTITVSLRTAAVVASVLLCAGLVYYGVVISRHVQADHASFHTMIRWINAADPLLKSVKDATGK